MIIRTNVDLAPYTTFGVHAQCAQLIEVASVAELRQALELFPSARVIGGGSNLLLTTDLAEPVIVNRILGIERDDSVVHVGAGENWHGLVTWCLENNLGGLENLALIPGTVGAAPMQNIGAYGTEQDQCFLELEAVERSSRAIRSFTAEECEFGYRSSVFKTSLNDQFVITRVSYQLSAEPHRLNVGYKDVALALSERKAPLTIRDVYDVVVSIRSKKLPDPAQIGNAGSFFKNPVLSSQEFAHLRSAHPEVPHYVQADSTVKVPAAWLIDQCGWKGARHGAVGVHHQQALVLVNHGGATGAEVLALALEIKNSVNARFGIDLHPEVNVW